MATTMQGPATTTTPTAVELEMQLRDRGFTAGPPPHITPKSLAFDARCAKHLRCVCGRRMGGFKAFHRGSEYAAVASCTHCGFGEVL